MAKVPAGDVRVVPDAPKSSEGKTLYEYTGDLYIPEGAKKLYAKDKTNALQQFEYSLTDFSYQDDYEPPSEDGRNYDECGDPECGICGTSGRG